jgi:hypothetical protein
VLEQVVCNLGRYLFGDKHKGQFIAHLLFAFSLSCHSVLFGSLCLVHVDIEFFVIVTFFDFETNIFHRFSRYIELVEPTESPCDGFSCVVTLELSEN